MNPAKGDYYPANWAICSQCHYSQYIIHTIQDVYKVSFPKLEKTIAASDVDKDVKDNNVQIVLNTSENLWKELSYLNLLRQNVGYVGAKHITQFLEILSWITPTPHGIIRTPPFMPMPDREYEKLKSHILFELKSRGDFGLSTSKRLPVILPLYSEEHHLTGYQELFYKDKQIIPLTYTHSMFEDNTYGYMSYNPYEYEDGNEIILVHRLEDYFKLLYWYTCIRKSNVLYNSAFPCTPYVILLPCSIKHALKRLSTYYWKASRVTFLLEPHKFDRYFQQLLNAGSAFKCKEFRVLNTQKWTNDVVTPIQSATSPKSLERMLADFYVNYAV